MLEHLGDALLILVALWLAYLIVHKVNVDNEVAKAAIKVPSDCWHCGKKLCSMSIAFGHCVNCGRELTDEGTKAVRRLYRGA